MGTRIRQVPAERRAAIASEGGAARAAALDPEARAEIARSGAAKTNSPLNYAQRIRRAWSTMPVAERRAVAEVMGGCKGLINMLTPKTTTPTTRKSPRKVAPAPVGETT